MKFNDISETERQAVGIILGKNTSITYERLVEMEEDDQARWISFASHIAKIENERCERFDIGETEKYLKKLT